MKKMKKMNMIQKLIILGIIIQETMKILVQE